MLEILKDKKYIFFDVGYTLDKPASGDWIFTNKFFEVLNERVKMFNKERLIEARKVALVYIEQNHLTKSVEEEYERFKTYYQMILDDLKVTYTKEELDIIAFDRANNMNNYIPYPDIKEVLSVLSKDYKLGIISDTWPSIENQLKHIGVYEYFNSFTYSYELGIFKPNPMMYIDALKKANCNPQETVFIDDRLENLEGAFKFGITPILIAANKDSDKQTSFTKIYSLSELIK